MHFSRNEKNQLASNNLLVVVGARKAEIFIPTFVTACGDLPRHSHFPDEDL